MMNNARLDILNNVTTQRSWISWCPGLGFRMALSNSWVYRVYSFDCLCIPTSIDSD